MIDVEICPLTKLSKSQANKRVSNLLDSVSEVVSDEIQEQINEVRNYSDVYNIKEVQQIFSLLRATLGTYEVEIFELWYFACLESTLEVLKLKSHLEMWLDNPALDKALRPCFQKALRQWNMFLNNSEPCDNLDKGIVICETVGDDKSNEGRNIKNRYSDILNVNIGFAGKLDDIDTVYNELSGKFPWAENIIEIICGQLAITKYDNNNNGFTKLPSLLLQGNPGCGKTYLLTEITKLIELPFALIPCGGSADSGGLLPVARGWATSRACGPVQTILACKKANPVIILDELEKSSVNGNNKTGSLPSALLSMMTGDGIYYDSCLQANVNLSAISFVGTANSLDGLPEALVDRFMTLTMSTPKEEHFNAIIENIVESENKKLKLYSKKLPNLEDWELDTLRSMMDEPHFSIRKLEKTYRLIMGKKMFQPETRENDDLSRILSFM